ncbi:MAG: hypothetical protein RIS75_760 [Actinomycetota bacterium]
MDFGESMKEDLMSRKLVGSLIAICMVMTGFISNPANAATSTPVLLSDMNTSNEGSFPTEYVSHAGIIYLSAIDAQKGRELFSYNPTTGVKRVFDINPLGDSTPRSITVDPVHGLVFFIAEIAGRFYLYKLDISSGTFSAIHEYGCSIWVDQSTAEPEYMEIWQGNLYFYSCNADKAISMWKYQSGLSPVKLSFPEYEETERTGAYTFSIAAANSALYFAIGVSSNPGVIAVTNGESAEFVDALVGYTQINGMVGFDGDLIFSAAHQSVHDDVYLFDGSTVSYVDQINDGNSYIYAHNFTVIEDELYFAATNPGSSWPQLFKMDSARNIFPLELANIESGFYPNSIVALNGDVYFAGYDFTTYESFLYVYNGTLVSKVNGFPEIPRYNPYYLHNTAIVVGSKLFFSGRQTYDDAEVWSFVGENPAAIEVDLNAATSDSYINTAVSYNNSLYFEMQNTDEGDFVSQLWTLSDQNVPVPVAGTQNSDISFITSLSNGLYFWKSTADEGEKLWVIDQSGQAKVFANTNMSDPGSGGSITELDGKIFTDFDDQMHVIDQNGTVTTNPTDVTDIGSDKVAIGDNVYFRGSSESDGLGTEIYKWTGTGAAQLAVDIREGSESSYPFELTAFNSKLYFLAEDGTNSLNPYWGSMGAEYLYSLSQGGTLTKMSDTRCSWSCEDDNSLQDLKVVGSSLYATGRVNYGNQKLLKLNSNTGSFVTMKRNGQDIIGAGTFSNSPTFTTIETFVDGVGCVLHRLNADGTLTDLFSRKSDSCLSYGERTGVSDLYGNLYFNYQSPAYGKELHMLPGAGTPTKPGKISKLLLAKNGATKSSLKLTWKAPALTGGKAITDYKIEYSLNGKKWTVFKHKVSKLATITITKLKKKTKYFIRVSAINAKGTGTSITARFSTK